MTERRWNFDYGSRRAFLGSLGAGTVVLAGCLSSSASGGSENTPVRGDPDASVTLEVYEDFACDFCQDYNAGVFPSIETEYIETEEIRYEHRDFPVVYNDGARQSYQAASAARAVYDGHGNEEFWQYKSLLMAEGDRVGSESPELYGELASELDLDADEIESAASDIAYEDDITADRERGQSANITGTPGFVINESQVSLESWDDLFEEIENAL